VLSAKRFGKYLTKHRDQIVGGLRLTGAPDRKEVMLWRVAGFGRVLPGFYQP
jgi:hypothetical protein